MGKNWSTWKFQISQISFSFLPSTGTETHPNQKKNNLLLLTDTSMQAPAAVVLAYVDWPVVVVDEPMFVSLTPS